MFIQAYYIEVITSATQLKQMNKRLTFSYNIEYIKYVIV